MEFEFEKKNFLQTVSKLSAFVDSLEDNKNYIVEVTEKRQKRSLNANSYAWVLINKIAENQGITKEEVYRHHIKEIGVFREIEIDERAVETIIKSWSSHGLGWVAEKVDYSRNKGFVIVNLYYGSSVYNTKQMTMLIENIVQDCHSLGIETITPQEISNLISLWETKKKKEVNE